jgi:hypothetical protein
MPSLTEVIAITSSVMRLFEQGKLGIDDAFLRPAAGPGVVERAAHDPPRIQGYQAAS